MTMTKDNAIKRLQRQDRLICGESYRDGSILILRALPHNMDWIDFSQLAAGIIKDATYRRDYFGRLVPDSNAPTLRRAPAAGACYLRDVKRFIPAVNVTIDNPGAYDIATAQAWRIAAESTLHMQVDGTFPETGPVFAEPEPEPITGYEGMSERFNASSIDDMAARFNLL